MLQEVGCGRLLPEPLTTACALIASRVCHDTGSRLGRKAGLVVVAQNQMARAEFTLGHLDTWPGTDVENDV
jgi:hypothetical protein